LLAVREQNFIKHQICCVSPVYFSNRKQYPIFLSPKSLILAYYTLRVFGREGAFLEFRLVTDIWNYFQMAAALSL